jgi:hypothetical protein
MRKGALAVLTVVVLAPAAAVAAYRTGVYAGSGDDGVNSIRFRAGTAKVRGLRFNFRTTGDKCSNGLPLTGSHRALRPEAARINRRDRFAVTLEERAGFPDQDVRFKGGLRRSRATGTLRVRVRFRNGVTCDSETMEWTARRQ